MESRFMKLLKEYTEALIIAFLLALVIRAFVVQAFKIPSGSMLETLQIGDHLLVNKFIYGVKIPFTHVYVLDITDPERGDVVVFEYPEDPSVDYIKRVVGEPGDLIEIRDKQVYVNGDPLDEPYKQHTDPHIQNSPRDNFGPYTVPEGQYFMMGDNRDESYDSRFWGPVAEESVVGLAWRIYWSWAGLGDIRFSRIGDAVHAR
jgi:signal peptidase I